MSSARLECADRLTRTHLLEGDEDIYAFAQLGKTLVLSRGLPESVLSSKGAALM